MSPIVRVLVLGAQPSDAPPVSLEEELRRIERSRGVQVILIRHTNFSDVVERIEAVRPHIVQFSGHGGRGGRLVLEDRGGEHELIPVEAIELLCQREVTRKYVRGVLLNACYSLPLAERLIKSFDFAIGTAHLISNPAAARFPAAFYSALASGEHLADACRAGEAEFSLKQTDNRPVLRCAEGIDPNGYRLGTMLPEKPVLYIHHYANQPSDCDMLAELRTQLRPLESSLEIWDQSQIPIGEPRTEAITRNLERAHLFLLLVSAPALGDDEWLKIKNRICVRMQARTARGLPVLLSACLFNPELFAGVGAINPGGREINTLTKAQRGKSWLAIGTRLASEASELKKIFAEERPKEQSINLQYSASPVITSANIGATKAAASETPVPAIAKPPAVASIATAITPAQASPSASMSNMSNHADVGVIIALQEEFREFYLALSKTPQAQEHEGQTYYSFVHPLRSGDGEYRVVATFVGAMGNDKSALLTERLLNRWQPEVVIMLGIAGGLHPDVKLGDVAMATQVDKYMDSGKASGPSTFGIEFGGEVYRATDSLIGRLNNFEFTHREMFRSWQQDCAKRLGEQVSADARAQLRATNVLGTEVSLLSVHLAASPVVIASAQFAQWVRSRDRNLKAVDMESGGVMLAAHSRVEPARTLVLRGISDLADERKQKMDELGQGGLRRCAMQNVTALLLTLLDAGVLPRSPAGVAAPAQPGTKASSERPGSPLPRANRIKEFVLEVLISDSDFEAFCQDYFNDVRKRFSSGMDRLAKATILMDHVPVDELLSTLEAAQPKRYNRFKHMLG